MWTIENQFRSRHVLCATFECTCTSLLHRVPRQHKQMHSVGASACQRCAREWKHFLRAASGCTSTSLLHRKDSHALNNSRHHNQATFSARGFSMHKQWPPAQKKNDSRTTGPLGQPSVGQAKCVNCRLGPCPLGPRETSHSRCFYIQTRLRCFTGYTHGT